MFTSFSLEDLDLRTSVSTQPTGSQAHDIGDLIVENSKDFHILFVTGSRTETSHLYIGIHVNLITNLLRNFPEIALFFLPGCTQGLMWQTSFRKYKFRSDTPSPYTESNVSRSLQIAKDRWVGYRTEKKCAKPDEKMSHDALGFSS